MLTQALHRGLQASALAAVLATPLAAEAAPQGSDLGLVDQMAAQLAARSDVFAATTASLTVVPVNMAGSCPRSFMLQIDLGAQSPGTLSYRIETLDGRVSQVFKARTGALEDGLFGARVEHSVALAKTEEGEEDPSLVTFSDPARPAPETEAETESEPGFFQRVFGEAPAADPSKGLRDQSFRVKIVAPNEIASTFDRVSVTCTDEELRHQAESAAAESQRDGGGRDRDTPDRDRDRGRDRGAGGGAAGAAGAGGGTID